MVFGCDNICAIEMLGEVEYVAASPYEQSVSSQTQPLYQIICISRLGPDWPMILIAIDKTNRA